MDLLHAVNFLEIQNNKDALRAQAKLDDLKDQAKALEGKGLNPISWHEFNSEVKQEKPKYMRNAVVGAGLGTALMGGLAVAMPAVLGGAMIAYSLGSGAVLGGLVGGYHDTENSQRHNKVEAYEQYLNQLQKGHQRQAVQSVQQAIASSNYIGQESPDTSIAPETIAANSAARDKEQDCGCGH